MHSLSGSVIQDLSGSFCIKDESLTRGDSSAPLMHHDPDRSWITDPDPDHPKGTHRYATYFQVNDAFIRKVSCFRVN